MAERPEREGPPQPGRYEPLPGLAGLPAFLWRRLSRTVRILLVLTTLALVASAVVAIPVLQTAKRRHEAVERRERAVAAARERRRLTADQQPSTAPFPGRSNRRTRPSRPPVVAALEKAIARDANDRIRAGRLPPPLVYTTRCSPNLQLPLSSRQAAGRAGGELLRCLAVTSQGGGRAPFAIGFEYVATVDWPRRRLTWCKTNPAPAEGFAGAGTEVPLPAACTRILR